jgi:hypothetical protein
MEEQFLCPLPCVKTDIIRICQSISLIYIAHVAVITCHNLWLNGLPIITAEITLWWYIMNVYQNMYPLFVSPQSIPEGCPIGVSFSCSLSSMACPPVPQQYIYFMAKY